MPRHSTRLADAKAHLSELTDRAERGEEFVITKHGRPVALLAPLRRPKRPLDVEAARELTRRLPAQPESAAETVRRMRDEERY